MTQGGPTLTLSEALKLSGFAGTGGQAKRLVQGGEVRVNGEVETRRKRALRPGDEIEVAGEVFVLELEPEESPQAPDATEPEGKTDDEASDAPVEPGGGDPER